MTHLLIPSALAAAALGVGLRPVPSPLPGNLPTLAVISAPFGVEAVPGRTIAHPTMPAADPARSVRVVLASPFAGR
ncbi:hypothetical protein [Methylorubrum suomiense]|uniref:Uncharacterized protein n=1 Tax=Methylorubrum suomiense TaxID=144191 RepID=A0ABQ4UQE7_9HYPH|nr:hypothetical protein [Methylorubrum suomiense]GJE74210.1 hypothetical protein BGCPKDLD_0779 [Methylorubrum suomiense]